MTKQFTKSDKLKDVQYAIRGPVMRESRRLEEEGHKVIKLNIGNPAPWGFDTPEEIMQDVIHNLPGAQGYCDSRGLFAARKAVMHECQRLSIPDVNIEDIFIGNGVSELIMAVTNSLLNTGDEVLIPAPDYPLWTAAVTLTGAKPVHYRCLEEEDWAPDIEHIKTLLTDNTKALLIINPNNPTGAVYDKETLLSLINIAREHDLVLFTDEIYDKIIFDDAEHFPAARYADDILCLTFNGLSKNYRAAGFRAGWLIISGAKHRASGFIEGLEMLLNMRLCANVPSQAAIQTALGGYQSINDLVKPKGRLYEQRNYSHSLITSLPGVECVKPKGAMYLFFNLDPKRYPITNDEQFALQLLQQEKVLIVQGSGLNLDDQQHFRMVFLPAEHILKEAIDRIGHFLSHYPN